MHDAILDATRSLLLEAGYAEVSMDRVAARAGVGKQTPYRRWPSKAPLVAEAIMDAYGRGSGWEVPDTGDISADLCAWMREITTFVEIPGNAALLSALAAAAAEDPQDNRTLYGQLTGPQFDRIVRRLQHGVDAGQIRSDADLVAIATAIVGALLFHILSRGSSAEETVNRFDGLIDALAAGMVVR